MQQSTSEMRSNQDIHVHVCMVQATQNTKRHIHHLPLQLLFSPHLPPACHDSCDWGGQTLATSESTVDCKSFSLTVIALLLPTVFNCWSLLTSACMLDDEDRCSRLLNAVALEAAKLMLILYHVLATRACAYSGPLTLYARMRIFSPILPPTNPLSSL